MPTTDQLNEAFQAWHRAVDQHIDMMRDVTRGEALDSESMMLKLGEIDVLHGTWMDMAERRDQQQPAPEAGRR